MLNHIQVETRETDDELTTRFERDAIPLMNQLYGGARRMTSCRADAEDLVQETMLKAYAQFRSFRTGTHMKAWLFRIMHNAWIDGYHRSRRRPSELLSGDFSDARLAACTRHGLDRVRSAESEAMDVLSDDQIGIAMAMLSEDLRHVIKYAYVDGFRYKDIAQIMNIPIGTVMSRIHRARKQLRIHLVDLGQECGFGRGELTKAAI